MTDDEVTQDRGVRGGEQISGAIADDGANGGEVNREGGEHPNGISGREGQKRQSRSDEQKRRRIMPAEIAGERMADRRLFDELVRRPVVSRRRVAVEHHSSRGPYVDEIGLHAGAVGCDDPDAVQITRGEIHRVRDDERESHELQRTRQLGVSDMSRRRRVEGHRASAFRCGHEPEVERSRLPETSCAAKARS